MVSRSARSAIAGDGGCCFLKYSRQYFCGGAAEPSVGGNGILKSLGGGPSNVTGRPPLPPFRYFDKGNLAVVGEKFAVLQSAGVQISGYVAWLVWALIHIQFLAENSLRFSVFLQWVWTYLSGKRSARLIIHQRSGS